MAISPVAQTLISQLGGLGRLSAMLGSRKFITDELALTFDFRLCRLANHCRITYNPDLDLYSVEFLKLGKATCRVVREFHTVYADQLRPLFENTTGLYLSL